MIAYGQPYDASRRLPKLDAMSTLAGGLVAAIAAAALAVLWQFSALPTFVGGPALLQAIVLAWSLAAVVRWSRLRRPAAAAFFGIVCGGASVFAFHEACYVHFVYDECQQVRRQLDRYEPSLTPAQTMKYEQAMARPFRVVNDYRLVPETGRRGLAGYLILQARIGQRTGAARILRGPGMWAVWCAEAALVIWLASLAAERAARGPFCEKCRRWFNGPQEVLRVPEGQAQILADTIVAGDVNRLGTIPRLPDDAGETAAIASLYVCEECGAALASVEVRDAENRGANRVVLSPAWITPEMATALGRVKAAPAGEAA